MRGYAVDWERVRYVLDRSIDRSVRTQPSNPQATGNDGTFQNPHALDIYTVHAAADDGETQEEDWVGDQSKDVLLVADREHNRTAVLDAATGRLLGAFLLAGLPVCLSTPPTND